MRLFLTFSLFCSLIFSSLGFSEKGPMKGIANLATYDDSDLLKEPFIAISLGWGCLPGIILRSADLHKKTFPFDVCAISFDSLCAVIENDFKDFLNPDYLFADSPGKTTIVTHLKYNFKIAHTFNTSCWFNSDKGLRPLNSEGEMESQRLSETYTRRIDRFMNVMNSGIPIYLFRFDSKNKIYTDSYEQNEQNEQMKLNSRNQANQLKSILKEKFKNSNFTLVYFYELENEHSSKWTIIDDVVYFYPEDTMEDLSRKESPPSFSDLFSDLIKTLSIN